MNLNHKQIKFSQIKVIFLLLFGLVVVCFAQESKLDEKAQESKPLRITEKPRPALPEDYGTLDAQVTVRFRVEFLANGQIGKISPVNSFIERLDKNALEAVRKIKFEPEVKNGELITVFKVIEYFYSWDGGWKVPQQNQIQTKSDEKAEDIIKRAIEKLGGEKYLTAKSQIGRGKYSILRDGQIFSFQPFVDVVAFPDKERTDFKSGSAKTIQTNVAKSGWVVDGEAQTIKDQSEEQINNYKRGIRTSLDNLLRGGWRKEGAKLEYNGKRQASLGKRNDVVKLTFTDGFTVEFEFSDESLPMKSIYKGKNTENEETTEEDHYAQFVDVSGIKTPFIIDHFSNKTHISRINYELIEFNKPVPDSIFVKPANLKDVKKDLKL